nr:DUF4381 domain-containing protein [Thermomonas sp.]
MIAPLPLKPMHPGMPPSWWPPAPGWWLVAVVLLVVVLAIMLWRRRRARRHAAWARLFDQTIDAAMTPAAKVAAVSQLLRRAARRIDPQADRLLGEEWLRFLDVGLSPAVFQTESGTLLVEGAFRPQVDADAVDALCVAARKRYLDWMRRA